MGTPKTKTNKKFEQRYNFKENITLVTDKVLLLLFDNEIFMKGDLNRKIMQISKNLGNWVEKNLLSAYLMVIFVSCLYLLTSKISPFQDLRVQIYVCSCQDVANYPNKLFEHNKHLNIYD